MYRTTTIKERKKERKKIKSKQYENPAPLLMESRAQIDIMETKREKMEMRTADEREEERDR